VNIGGAAWRPADDEDDDVTDLMGAAAGQDAKRKRETAPALPVCGALSQRGLLPCLSPVCASFFVFTTQTNCTEISHLQSDKSSYNIPAR
jgi:hypothetical protein